MNIRMMAGALALAVLGAGCVGTQVEFPKSVTTERLDLSHGRPVVGRASGFNLFECIPIGVNTRQSRALENLKMEAGSDQLTDIRVKDSWTYLFVGVKYGTTMTAMAYPERNAAPDPATSSLRLKLEELKGLRDKGLLTQEEYETARKKAIGI